MECDCGMVKLKTGDIIKELESEDFETYRNIHKEGLERISTVATMSKYLHISPYELYNNIKYGNFIAPEKEQINKTKNWRYFWYKYEVDRFMQTRKVNILGYIVMKEDKIDETDVKQDFYTQFRQAENYFNEMKIKYENMNNRYNKMLNTIKKFNEIINNIEGNIQ